MLEVILFYLGNLAQKSCFLRQHLERKGAFQSGINTDHMELFLFVLRSISYYRKYKFMYHEGDTEYRALPKDPGVCTV